ncbi:MAG: hypothetical protein ACRDYW_13130 [Acidimicrobiales bacterium]
MTCTPSRPRRGLAVTAAAGLLFVAVPAGAQVPEPTEPEPYRDPPFTCEVHDYGTEAPTLPAPADDPLCVEYDKTNITVSTLEAVDFLAAEPGRVALVAGKCSYWQQDHWVIRVAPDTTPLVEWEGSYWYDARTGTAAGILRGLRVGGEPADGQAFAEAMRPIFGDESADELAAFADEDGGGGATFALPEGFAYEDCAGPGSEPSDPADPSDPSESSASPPDGAEVAGRTTDMAHGALPRTGAAPHVGLALVAALVGLAARRLLHAVS